MENVIDAIRAAVAPDATTEAKAAGVAACNAILSALQATPGEKLGTPPRIEIGPAAAAFAAMVRSAPPEQLLDLAIAKLRSMVPADGSPSVPKISIPLVRVPR